MIEGFDLSKAVMERIAKDIQAPSKPSSIYASSLGHTCNRSIVYEHLNFADKKPISVKTKMRFRLGDLLEKEARDLIDGSTLDGEKIQIVQNQSPFEYKSKGDILFRGKIDGMVLYKKELFPIEIKSMQKYAYEKIESFEDIAYSDSFYIRKYAYQLLAYLLTTEKEYGMFWLVNVATGQMKHIWVKLDYAFAEKIVKQAEEISEAIKSNKLPDAKPDSSYCGMCSFSHICLPNLVHNIPVIESIELLENLIEREKYEEAKSLYAEADKKVKAMVKGQAELMCGDFLITGKSIIKNIKATEASTREEWHVKIINCKTVDKDK